MCHAVIFNALLVSAARTVAKTLTIFFVSCIASRLVDLRHELSVTYEVVFSVRFVFYLYASLFKTVVFPALIGV